MNKMTIYKVIEVWNRLHTDAERDLFHDKLLEMYNEGRFIRIKDENGNESNSEYIMKMSKSGPYNEKVIKRFIDEKSAQEYINFVSNLDPISLTIEVENKGE